MRRMLADRASRGHPDDGGPGLLVAEFPLAGTRADLATVTGEAIVLVEIKTATDTLTRLPRQAVAYAAVADRCGVAVAPRHADRAAEQLPAWWRVERVDTDGLLLVRAGEPNPETDPVATAGLLWRAELAEAVADVGLTGGTAGLDRDGLAAVLARVLADDTDRLRRIVRQRLLARRWVDVEPSAGADGHLRHVRPTTPSWKNRRRGRIRAHERRR